MSLDHIRIVLVRPKASGNVGSVARAMRNLGFTDLALVSPRDFKRFAARAMAVHAADLLDSMQMFSSLGEAVADCSWVVGTTCRPGSYRRRPMTPRQAAEEILAVAARNRVALVFGPEDHGLSNEDLKLCHELVSIPTHADYSSLNVAQAALVCLYEIFLARHPVRSEIPSLASSRELEHMYDRLQEALLKIGFLHGDNPDHILFSIRRLFGGARPEQRDVAIWLGVARQIEWFAEGGREVVAEKERRGARLK